MLGNDHQTRFHGATLSSFTSIAMDPFPLISFALRIPSRMATALNGASSDAPSDMVVNLLSAKQALVAERFSRADLHPRPFDETDHSLSVDDLPIIRGSLGALSCKLISRGLPLHDMRLLRAGRFDLPPTEDVDESHVVSQLFIARVIRVEDLGDEQQPQLPLLYYRRQYTTTH
uniref:Flavin reductase like domain-containing protein n=1 Tax=Mycena chlorophos TaxID=658473 RepID=A0ABQ0LJY0_MYCCL|nr:predicted protein [Mycena chlorophos]